MKIRMKRIPGGVNFEPPEDAKQYLVKLFDRGAKKGDVYDVEISLPRKIRSTGTNSQNAHFNGHCQQIAIETGNDFDDVKLGIKFRACDMGYPCKMTKSGDRIPQSESKSSTTECAILIEAAHVVAAELDIRLKEYEE